MGFHNQPFTALCVPLSVKNKHQHTALMHRLTAYFLRMHRRICDVLQLQPHISEYIICAYIFFITVSALQTAPSADFPAAHICSLCAYKLRNGAAFTDA
jgi:hypothetical protein